MDIDQKYIEKALENENNESVLNLTIEEIKRQKNDILQKLNLPVTELKCNTKKLKDYRYIDNVNDINFGAYIRWINLKKYDNLILTNGGIVCDIKIGNGIEILCRNNLNRLFQIKFDENLIFQKLSNQEIIILNLLKEINK